MIKYFLKVLFTILFLNLLTRVVFGEVILNFPQNGEILENNIVDFTWSNISTDQDYIYKYYIYPSGTIAGGAVTRILEENELRRSLVNHNIYLWKVQYHPKDSFEGRFDFETETYIFAIGREIPEDMLEEFTQEKEPEDEETEENEEEEKKEDIEEGEEKDTKEREEEQTNVIEVRGESVRRETQPNVFSQISKIPTNQSSKLEWNTVSSKSESKDSKEDDTGNRVVCQFKYLKRGSSLEKIYCNIPKVQLEEETKYVFSDRYSIFVKGEVLNSFNIQIDEYECKFSLLKPSTWFQCQERFVKSRVLSIRPNIRFFLYEGRRRARIKSFFLENNNFRLTGGHFSNTEDLKLVQRYRMVHSDYDLFHDERREYILNPKFREEDKKSKSSETPGSYSNKPFIFPFKKIIGVTQWYGNTVYQSPHTGIDFGARKEEVLAVGNGTVVGKGWDSHYGECLSGGNYLRVKQENGMHTVYFHLKDSLVNTGDFVRKGDVIAVSGNSGAWNCQPLGYHLHFETRLNASSSSHSNPVKYIDVDWNKIPTLGHERYPGRLSGENPHPGW